MSSKRKTLNFREYWDLVGTENIKLIVADLGSSLQYFRMLRYGIKRPGREQALKILDAARRHTAPFEPNLELLLAGVPRTGRNPAAELPPATEFIRARKRLLSKGEQQREETTEA